MTPAPVRPSVKLSGHVLMVEDNAVNQLLAARLTEALGLTSRVVTDGQGLVGSRGYTGVLPRAHGLQMPGMDGYEATRRLRQNAATAGMNDYISKPIRLDRLREVLSHYLPAASPVLEIDSSK